MTPEPPSSPRSGMALVLALAATVVAAGLLMLLQARALRRSAEARALLENGHLRIAAAETARAALHLLSADENLSVDHPGEDWAQILEKDWGDGLTAWAQVEDAAAHVNLNNLGFENQPGRSFHEIARNAFACCGFFEADAPVAALADYIDADADGPYEAAFYRRAEPPLVPPDRELWAPAEMLDVYRISADLFAPPAVDRRTRDELFGGDFRRATALIPDRPDEPVPVNVNTASREALLAIAGIDRAELVRSAMALRDLHPFDSLSMLFAARPELAAALEGALDVKSSYYRVHAVAERDGRRRSVLAWARRDTDGSVHLLQWLEGET